jgi:hypothetical protein
LTLGVASVVDLEFFWHFEQTILVLILIVERLRRGGANMRLKPKPEQGCLK